MRELRPYNVKDVRALVGILSKLAKSNLQNILSAEPVGGDAVADKAEERTGQLMFAVLSECWTYCEGEIFEWFASLNNMTVEQFDSEPPGIVLDTIEAIVDRQESRDFFSQAYLLFLRIGSSKTST